MLIKQIDVPVRQVLIESRIVEATDTFSKNIGARLGINDTTLGSATAAASSGSSPGGGIGNIDRHHYRSGRRRCCGRNGVRRFAQRQPAGCSD